MSKEDICSSIKSSESEGEGPRVIPLKSSESEGEGPRVRALKEALDQTTCRVLAAFKPTLFAKCFPTFTKGNEAVVETILGSVVQAIQAALNEDLAVLLDDDVVRPLEELSSVANNYSGPKDKAAWRPPGDPACQMSAHDAQVLQHEKQRLLESVSAARTTSGELLQKVKATHKECQENQKEIHQRMAAISELVDISNTIHIPETSELYCGTSKTL
ncbi:hypothetical protein Pmani_000690 [Petrolisthes manimaculis]|uniref:Polyamine-modulated factor 1 n=1 Tax=Petrolisthes manimaculis TaxID=1843537 RepID=A0AAE1QL70_9EUCA|nr:hypothetical protein Pmani_000690 [Petrolisthes manimaculis]